MTSVARAVPGMTVQAVGMPRGAGHWAPPRAANTEATVEDGYRYRSIGSLQALGLAIPASILLTALLWIAL